MDKAEVTARIYTKEFNVKLPILNVTDEMALQLKQIAKMRGVSQAEIRRDALQREIDLRNAHGIVGGAEGEA